MICGRGHSGRAAAWRAAFGTMALLLALPVSAAAADLPVLRGGFGSGYLRWDGVNFGVQAGYANLNSEFSGTTNSIIANMLRNSTLESENSISSWDVLSNDISNSVTYGGFLGYNLQWDQLVVGFDLAYNRPTDLQTSSGPTTLARQVSTSDGIKHAVYTTAQSSTKLVDYGTLRLRAGYAFGQFLPYAVVGGALGRFNYSTTVALTDYMTDSNNNTSTYTPATQTDAKNNAFVAGIDVGVGMDVALLPNVFLRGEWEYIAFAGVAGIHSYMNVGRVGLGVRF